MRLLHFNTFAFFWAVSRAIYLLDMHAKTRYIWIETFVTWFCWDIYNSAAESVISGDVHQFTGDILAIYLYKLMSFVVLEFCVWKFPQVTKC